MFCQTKLEIIIIILGQNNTLGNTNLSISYNWIVTGF